MARRMSSVPIDAESRGQVRQWKRELAVRFARLREIYDSDAALKAASDFGFKSGRGQQRALAQLRQLFSLAQFEAIKTAKPSSAVWSFLRPRERSAIASSDPRFENQGAVSVESIVAGRLAGGKCLSSHIWTVEFSDHALGRLWQRSRLDFDKTVYAAHKAALSASEAQVRKQQERLLLPAPGGAFLCWV
jgi:hypothetical protein